MEGKLSENIGNAFIGARNHCLVIMPVDETRFVDYMDTGVMYDSKNPKENVCGCDTIITPSEMLWLMMYWYNHSHYMATVDDPMCDRIEELVKVLEGIKRYDAPAVVTEWYNKHMKFYNQET